MPIDNDHANEFASDLRDLIISYGAKISNAEVIGILMIMIDDISEKTRRTDIGPSPLS